MYKKNNLGIYGSDIKNFKPLPADVEKKLCKEMVGGNINSRNKLISSNLWLVVKLAMKYKNLGVDLDELISEGNKGLITATYKYDIEKDNKFSTYAYFWIKQGILSTIENNKKWNPLSKNNVLNYDDYGEQDLIVNMNEFEDGYNINQILKMVDGLPKRDSSIVKHYFGLSGYTEMNTIELSEKYNISTMRVSSIIENSIRKIRCNMLEII